MAEKIQQHTHCQMCGKAIPFKEALCSEDCKEKYQNLLKKRRKTIYLLYGIILVFFVVILASVLLEI
jgi:predicted nucleic acid-binding Zn ribbon protein